MVRARACRPAPPPSDRLGGWRSRGPPAWSVTESAWYAIESAGRLRRENPKSTDMVGLEAWHRCRVIELVARGGLDLRSNPLGWDAAREGLAPGAAPRDRLW